MELVHPFVIEENAAIATVDFELVVALAAVRQPRRLEDSQSPFLKWILDTAENVVLPL
jgi:hypothetical protein